VRAPLVELLTETPLSPNQKIAPAKDPWHMLTATFQIAGSYGGGCWDAPTRIVVLKPVALRRDLAQTLKTAAKNYAG